MGRTALGPGAQALLRLESGEADGCQSGNLYGCYLHGFFDTAECREAVLSALCERKGVSLQEPSFDLKAYKEAQYDLLTDSVRAHLDMELIHRILEEGI